jgi:hypothetical protein
MPFVSHEETMKKHLADPGVAAEYLNECFEDGNEWLIADAIKLVSELHGIRKSRTLINQIEKIRAELAPSKIRLRFEAVPKRNAHKAALKTRRTPTKRTKKTA